MPAGMLTDSANMITHLESVTRMPIDAVVVKTPRGGIIEGLRGRESLKNAASMEQDAQGQR